VALALERCPRRPQRFAEDVAALLAAGPADVVARAEALAAGLEGLAAAEGLAA
jgi:hypothetical protein